MRGFTWRKLSRRGLLSDGMIAAGSAALAALASGRRATAQGSHSGHTAGPAGTAVHAAHGNMMTVGEVDAAQNGFDPTAMLTDWERGTTSQLPDGRTMRTFEVIG